METQIFFSVVTIEQKLNKILNNQDVGSVEPRSQHSVQSNFKDFLFWSEELSGWFWKIEKMKK
jgi:hypothetical protein